MRSRRRGITGKRPGPHYQDSCNTGRVMRAELHALARLGDEQAVQALAGDSLILEPVARATMEARLERRREALERERWWSDWL